MLQSFGAPGFVAYTSARKACRAEALQEEKKARMDEIRAQRRSSGSLEKSAWLAVGATVIPGLGAPSLTRRLFFQKSYGDCRGFFCGDVFAQMVVHGNLQ